MGIIIVDDNFSLSFATNGSSASNILLSGLISFCCDRGDSVVLIDTDNGTHASIRKVTIIAHARFGAGDSMKTAAEGEGNQIQSDDILWKIYWSDLRPPKATASQKYQRRGLCLGNRPQRHKSLYVNVLVIIITKCTIVSSQI